MNHEEIDRFGAETDLFLRKMLDVYVSFSNLYYNYYKNMNIILTDLGKTLADPKPAHDHKTLSDTFRLLDRLCYA